ncbi:MAG: PepSY domain-containing protein [Alphaproteobacteria bacterium]
MKNVLLVSATCAFLASGSAMANAESEHCNAPENERQPREALQKKLEAEGWQVKRIKAEDGCYEVYAFNQDGKRVEAYFDPKSLEMMKNKSDD